MGKASEESWFVNFQDKTLRCRDCEAEFIFSVGEQEYFASKGYINDPTRCLACRAINRARQNVAAGGAAQAAIRQLHGVTCAQCGNPAQVPFLPRLDKPVYCSACFDQVRAPRLNPA